MNAVTKYCLSVCVLLIVVNTGCASLNEPLTPTSGQSSHPFSVHDMLAMKRIGSVEVSPDQERLVFSLRQTDLEANGGRTDLWMIDVDGTNLRQLTTSEAGDFNPCWSPNADCLYFLSTRSGSSQVWCLPLDGGEAHQVTDLPLDVYNLKLSPDGTTLVYSLEVYPGSSPQETRERLDAIAEAPTTGRIYESMFVRHWDTWKDGRRSHLFTHIIDGGEPVDIMGDMDADCPSKPFGGAEDYCFTPDSQGLIFSARDVGASEPWSTDFDLYWVSCDAQAEPACLTESNEAWDTQPVFSPDGKTLAYLAMERPGYESDRLRIVLKSWPEGPTRVLTQDWDRSPSSIVWSADSQSILANAGDIGQVPLFKIDVDNGTVTPLVKEGTVAFMAPVGDRIVYGLHHLQSPTEVYSINTEGADVQTVTSINAEALSQARMGDYEQFSFAGWNNETVYGFVVKPVDFDPAKKYPVAFLIHGGPQGSFNNNFHYRWNPQAYSGAGYAAVMIDFHGSTGYGQGFTDAIRGDWGGKPLEDLQKGLAAALEQYPWLDGERVGALGASFGGYMINWIAGQWPDRFRCLINHDGNLDERMAYYDTEELWFPEWDHLGTPWDNPEAYEKHNPVNYVGNWKTPMLVIHGGQDFRVVETQGLGTFNALQRRGIPSKLLYFPDENHWVLQPHNSIQWHETVIDWLDQWVK